MATCNCGTCLVLIQLSDNPAEFMMLPLLLFVDSQCVYMWLYRFLKAIELVDFMDLFIVSVNFGISVVPFSKFKLMFSVLV